MRSLARCLGSVPARVGAVSTLIPTLLFAFCLSVSPHFHERIHADASKSAHGCAVTMFAGGNCERTGGDQLSAAPKTPSLSSAFIPRRVSISVAAVEISILEHAPPKNS
jgi:hypothetical protein